MCRIVVEKEIHVKIFLHDSENFFHMGESGSRKYSTIFLKNVSAPKSKRPQKKSYHQLWPWRSSFCIPTDILASRIQFVLNVTEVLLLVEFYFSKVASLIS